LGRNGDTVVLGAGRKGRIPDMRTIALGRRYEAPRLSAKEEIEEKEGGESHKERELPGIEVRFPVYSPTEGLSSSRENLILVDTDHNSSPPRGVEENAAAQGDRGEKGDPGPIQRGQQMDIGALIEKKSKGESLTSAQEKGEISVAHRRDATGYFVGKNLRLHGRGEQREEEPKGGKKSNIKNAQNLVGKN